MRPAEILTAGRNGHTFFVSIPAEHVIFLPGSRKFLMEHFEKFAYNSRAVRVINILFL
jgi:hypothetical protein